MTQAKPADHSEQIPDGQDTQKEVCGYIFDLLGSLETIAAQHELPALARLIAIAKNEASFHR